MHLHDFGHEHEASPHLRCRFLIEESGFVRRDDRRIDEAQENHRSDSLEAWKEERLNEINSDPIPRRSLKVDVSFYRTI